MGKLGALTAQRSASGPGEISYDVFGKPTITGGNGTVRGVSNYGNRFLFTGREYIYTFGLYDYRHRMYLPRLGRFIQTDPIGFEGDSANLYRYCSGNPIDHSDPMGLNPEPYRMTHLGGSDSGRANYPDDSQAGVGSFGAIQKNKVANIEDVTTHELKRQLDGTTVQTDETTQTVPTEDGFEVDNVTATQVKVPKGGRSSGASFGYEAIGEEHLKPRSDAVRINHVHKDEGKKQAVPTHLDVNAVRESGKEMHFSSRYLARHGKDPEGRVGNHIIIRPTGPPGHGVPRQDYHLNPELRMQPLK